MRIKRFFLLSVITVLLLLFFPLPTSANNPERDLNDWMATGGATQTVDFWMTHADYANHILTVHLDGSIPLAWITLTGMPEVLGLFWASPSTDTTGIPRDPLCKMRLFASQEAVAAYLNSALSNGEPLPISWEEILMTLAGTDTSAMEELGNLMADWNETGAGVEIVDDDGYMVGPKDRWGSQSAADPSAANCLPNFQPPVMPPKPPKLR